MTGLSRFVLRHKLVVAVFWLAVLAVGVVASARLSGRLSAQFALPGAASYQADQQILRDYGNGGPGYPEVVVVRLPSGRAAASAPGRRAMGVAFAAVAARPGLRVADYASTGNRGFLTGEPWVSCGVVVTPYPGLLSPPRPCRQLTAPL